MKDLFRFVLLDAVSCGLLSFENFSIMVSYPIALPAYRRDGFVKIVKEAIFMAAQEYTTLEKPGSAEKICCDTMTESEAAGRYFIDVIGENIAKKLCVIDIGGGTSDIYYTEGYSEKDGTTTVRQIASSMKTGARETLIKALSSITARSRKGKGIRSQYLYNLLLNSRLMYDHGNTHSTGGGVDEARLRLSDVRNLIKLASHREGKIDEKGKDILDFTVRWEDILTRKVSARPNSPIMGDILLEYVSNPAKKGQVTDAEGKMLLTIIALGIAGTVYYASMIARGGKNKDFSIPINFAFAGNGSKMLTWLCHEIGELENFFLPIVRMALNKPQIPAGYIKINTEHNHKTVAGIGMFSGGKLKGTKHNKLLPITIAGESYPGIPADSIEECEERLQKSKADQISYDDARRTQYNERKTSPTHKNSSGGAATTDMPVSLFDPARAGDVGTEEFKRFLLAYNSAVENSSPFDVRLYQVDLSDDKGRPNHAWKKRVPQNTWELSRKSEIEKYIKSAQGKQSHNVISKSFFQIELEVLIDTMLEMEM